MFTLMPEYAKERQAEILRQCGITEGSKNLEKFGDEGVLRRQFLQAYALRRFLYRVAPRFASRMEL